MLSLRYKSRRVESTGRPRVSVSRPGPFLEQRSHCCSPAVSQSSGDQLNTTSQRATSVAAQHQQQHQQQQPLVEATVENTRTFNAVHQAEQPLSTEGTHGAPKGKTRKQRKQIAGDDNGEDGRGLKRMRLNSKPKGEFGQRGTRSNSTELSPSADEKRETMANLQQQKERQLLLVKKFSGRVAAAGVIDRLQGGRFRSLNEYLYTKKGSEAFVKYQKEPQLFDIYHTGYRAQVRRWPLNPLDCVATWLSKKPKEWVVGDFGCGEAALALRFPERTFHSFDLVAANERITACDISSVPLPDSSLDVAVFCLSLMGQDWPAFLKEARRVLKRRGVLIIAEVSSRITSLSAFVAAVEGLGFKNTKQKDLASFFVLLVFQAKEQSKEKLESLSPCLLQPCLYKRR